MQDIGPVESNGITAARKKGNANLRPWKKGQSGNPSGRPAGEISITAVIRRKLAELEPGQRKTVCEAMVADWLSHVRSPSARSAGVLANIIIDRIDGKLSTDVNFKGDVKVEIVRFGREDCK
jgi:tryptophanase